MFENIYNLIEKLISLSQNKKCIRKDYCGQEYVFALNETLSFDINDSFPCLTNEMGHIHKWLEYSLWMIKGLFC